MTSNLPIAPTLDGLHHLKFPVTDLDASTAWWRGLLNARRREAWDHVAPDGTLFGVMLEVPGLPCPIELRLAPGSAAALAGFDPLTLAVADREDLAQCVRRAEALDIDTSGILRGALGWLAAFRDPDGLILRLYTRENHAWDMAGSDLDSPWIRPLPRDHPHDQAEEN